MPSLAPSRARRSLPWRARRFLFALGVGGLVTVTVAVAAVEPVPLPDTAGTDDSLWVTGYLCTATVDEAEPPCDYDTAIDQLSPTGEDRVFVPYDRVPSHLIEAVLATEDQHYFTHPGVDPTGIARAAVEQAKDLLPGVDGSNQGGSTITQQHVKLVSGDDATTVERKLREVVRAVRLERDLTADAAATTGWATDPRREAKERLLEAYLNRVWFGRRAYGVEAAANNYFDKSVDQLTVAEAAYLAGLIRNPTRADHAAHPTEAERRRAATLELMVAAGYLTEDDAAVARAEPWTSSTSRSRSLGPNGGSNGGQLGVAHAVAAVHGQLNRIFPDAAHERRGLRVHTTLDRDLQRAAHQAQGVSVDRSGREVALVSLDVDGRVVALTGGSDWNRSQVNLALGAGDGGRGHAAAGLWGPVILAGYLDQGNDPDHLFSSPPRLGLIRGDTRFDIYGGGPVDGNEPPLRTAHDAVVHASNTSLVQVLDQVDLATVTGLARRLGVDSPIGGGPALALGLDDVAVIEIAAVYAAVDRGGLAVEPALIERVESVDGDTLCWYPSSPDDCVGPSGGEPSTRSDRPELPDVPDRPMTRVLPVEVNRQVRAALLDVVAEGTGQAARLVDRQGDPIEVAGKTAVSNGYRDLWFVGSACGLTTAVWVEGPGPRAGIDRSELSGEAIEIWRTYMAAAVSADDSGCRPPEPS